MKGVGVPGHWDEDLTYKVEEWKQAVADDVTRLGYWDWVEYRVEQMAIDQDVREV